MMFEEESDPAMLYEGLLRTVFSCGKRDDPWGYAGQELFTHFVPHPTIKGKRILSIVVIKLLLDKPSDEVIEKLKRIDDSIWNAKTQEEVISIIDELSVIVDNDR